MPGRLWPKDLSTSQTQEILLELSLPRHPFVFVAHPGPASNAHPDQDQDRDGDQHESLGEEFIGEATEQKSEKKAERKPPRLMGSFQSFGRKLESHEPAIAIKSAQKTEALGPFCLARGAFEVESRHPSLPECER